MATPAAEREAVFQRGLEAYRGDQFYEAHEFWEQLWEDEDSDEHRRFLQALIQAASAMHKVRNNVAPRGALRLLERAHALVEGLPDVYGGIELGRFRDAVARCRGEVDRLLAAGRHDLDAGFVPPIERAADALSWRARPPEPAPNAQQQLKLGVVAYRGRRYYEAHELWEVVWRDEAHPVMKAFLHGLILVAAGMHKLETMGSASGAARLLQSAGVRLADVPEGTGGMAIGLLREDIVRAKDAIERLSSEGKTSLDVALVPRMDPLGKA